MTINLYNVFEYNHSIIKLYEYYQFSTCTTLSSRIIIIYLIDFDKFFVR